VKTYIALFRGINVGGNNILPMKDLVKTLDKSGCENVRTYIQSGNVVFRHKSISKIKLAEEIRSAIEFNHGFKPWIMILDSNDLMKAVKNNPYPTEIGKAVHFYFLEAIPDSPDIKKMKEIKAKTEEFKLTDKVCYLYAPDGIGRSKLAAKIETCVGVTATARNWNTVNKLTQMINE
jgi:uncharacterized protein (DUF1697 family)